MDVHYWQLSLYIDLKSNNDRNKTLPIKEYLCETRPYLKDIISHLQKSDIWKIQLMIAINFVPCTDTNEQREMHSRSDNITSRVTIEQEVIAEISESLVNRYQTGLETSVRDL